MLTEEEFLRIVDAFGYRRVLFGTDNPWSDAKKSLDWIKALAVEEEVKQEILGGNALRLLTTAEVF